MSKTVPLSKFQELKGIDRISSTVHEMRCLFREITKSDFGIDGEIEIVVPKDDGKGFKTTGGIIKVQAKSGESYVKQDTNIGFSTPVEKPDLETWYKLPYPVAFIVYHPSDNKLYWKEIKNYVRSTPGVFQPPLLIRLTSAPMSSRLQLIRNSVMSPERVRLASLFSSESGCIPTCS